MIYFIKWHKPIFSLVFFFLFVFLLKAQHWNITNSKFIKMFYIHRFGYELLGNERRWQYYSYFVLSRVSKSYTILPWSSFYEDLHFQSKRRRKQIKTINIPKVIVKHNTCPSVVNICKNTAKSSKRQSILIGLASLYWQEYWYTDPFMNSFSLNRFKY